MPGTEDATVSPASWSVIVHSLGHGLRLPPLLCWPSGAKTVPTKSSQ